MKVRMKSTLTGLYNGRPWPARGEEATLPDVTAEGMIEAGHAEKVSAAAKVAKKVEQRPAANKATETRESD